MLSAACDHADFQAVFFDLLHQLFCSRHFLCRWAGGKESRLVGIHFCGFLVAEFCVPLLARQQFNGFHATHAFILVGTAEGHVELIVCHGVVPALCMVGHGVVDDTVHVEKHGFGAKLPKAVLL